MIDKTTLVNVIENLETKMEQAPIDTTSISKEIEAEKYWVNIILSRKEEYEWERKILMQN